MKIEPLRSCIGWNEKKTKKELLRIVREEEGYSLDLRGRKNGRGAYICPNLSCFDKAEKRKAFFRAFKENIPEDTLKELREEVERLAR